MYYIRFFLLYILFSVISVAISQSVSAQTAPYIRPIVGKYHPVDIIVNPNPYPNKLVTVGVGIDAKNLANKKYIKIAFTPETPSKVGHNIISGDTSPLQAGQSVDVTKDLSLTFQNDSPANFNEFFKLINNYVSGCVITDGDKLYQGDCIELEILKAPPTSSVRIRINITDVTVKRVAKDIPVFVELLDTLPGGFYNDREAYIAYTQTYPELLNRVKITTLTDEKYRISWDPISLSTSNFQHYELSIYKMVDGQSPCGLDNPFRHQFISEPWYETQLLANEQFILQIRVHQNNSTNHKIDCGTYYYLNTNDIVGAEIPAIPVGSYRDDYKEVTPYFPPVTSVPGEDASVLIEKIQSIENQINQVKQKQDEISTDTALLQEDVDKQRKELTGIRALLQNIVTFLENLFSSKP